MATALHDALRYAAIGWHVFPCTPAKRPYTEHGFHDATTDEAVIRGWWERWPDARVGVACLASGLVVIDCDRRPDQARDGVQAWSWLQDENGAHMCGLIASTPSGGEHYVYLHPGDRKVTTCNNVIPGSGIDVRGDGGYFVVPSASDPGRQWQVGDPFEVGEDGSTDISPMPKWVLELVASRRADSAPEGADTKTMPIPEVTVAAIRDALKWVDCDPHDPWKKVGMALKSTGGGDQAFQLWIEWASRSPKFDEREHRYQWRHMREFRWDGSEIRLGTLFHLAKLAGWTPSVDVELGAEVALEPDEDFRPEPPAAEVPFDLELLNVGGALGDLLDWIRSSSLRDQPALALASSIAVCSAILGRRVATPTGLRTNLYLVGVGETGCGKEAGISEPIAVLKHAGLDRFLGTSDWTSAAAIRQSLQAHPSQVCLIDEFGKWMQRCSGPRVSPHLQGVKDMVMQVHSRAAGVLLGVGYANQKNNPKVDLVEPNLCIYGASTPDELFGALDHGAIADGFLNRFLFVFVDDRLPKMRRLNLAADTTRDAARERLFRSLCKLEEDTRPAGDVAGMTTDGSTSTGCRVVPWDSEAAALIEEVQDRADREMTRLRGGSESALADLWVRYGATVAKLAMLHAVTDDANRPVQAHDVRWADRFAGWCTERTTQVCSRRIASSKHEADTNRVLRVIIAAGEAGVSGRAIVRATQWLRRNDRRDILASLVEGGRVVSVQQKSKTKPATTYFAAEFVNRSRIGQEPEAGVTEFAETA